MEGGHGSDAEREEDDSVSELLRDRFRLSTISIAEAEAKKIGMDISEQIIACISDLAFKYTEQLAKDLELFAQHAGRKSVNMEDVILSSLWSCTGRNSFLIKVDLSVLIHVKRAHRNEHLAASMRSFSNDLKAKEPQSEKKRKKMLKKEDKATTSTVHIPDI
ncbi:protein MHF1 homolog isoform X1 [Jatropha curcas]|uniref:protein MHF1 homolog isoform X1 n=1 Tax=Jatropha curcas TaxID=180498 RepID=UPI0009D6FCEA|nr:protein MHF1 homolog isoform X1 [Jatropha curcas]XP_020540803.1 protein MHF1 homolog isoform X1 [Jatropha curcas]XP_020540804.1 protein MHF1 homolog isoform X1 [Jatropha curcas]XP_020540805.1 protein MHF1 homolog isoform X1 [Jatropha curcas]XP_020540806.1 protein MHF1 homolog isoform X1 [Jatropha curcas]XP_037495570.1 protein MHF1 homolog isoform X1 [Jatropha curcas]XP_037495571.1 protein MHF1 homolog isoform X1 [Jatropha curcas]